MEMNAYQTSRMRRMPDMIEAAERKLAGLYREAARYRMGDILRQKSPACEAWEREVLVAKLEALTRGQPTSLRDTPDKEERK